MSGTTSKKLICFREPQKFFICWGTMENAGPYYNGHLNDESLFNKTMATSDQQFNPLIYEYLLAGR